MGRTPPRSLRLPLAHTGAGPVSAAWTRIPRSAATSTIASYAENSQLIEAGLRRALYWRGGIAVAQARLTRSRVTPSACRYLNALAVEPVPVAQEDRVVLDGDLELARRARLAARSERGDQRAQHESGRGDVQWTNEVKDH